MKAVHSCPGTAFVFFLAQAEVANSSVQPTWQLKA